jgi:uncharacterized protein YndB with AHSA1/START domain
MQTTEKTAITIEALVNAPVETVWKFWTDPKHITQWCNASDDWHAPHAENDVQVNGRFKTTMAAKDGSMSFDFTGVYTNINQHKLIEYTIDDGRKVSVTFSTQGNQTKVVETFEAESINSPEMQKSGWQSILNNFKRHVEVSQSQKQ